jgi:hypothetical protein
MTTTSTTNPAAGLKALADPPPAVQGRSVQDSTDAVAMPDFFVQIRWMLCRADGSQRLGTRLVPHVVLYCLGGVYVVLYFTLDLLPATGVRPQPSPAAAAGIAGSQTALRSRAGLSHLTTSSSRPVRRLASWWGALPAAVAAAAAAAAAAAPSAGILTRRIQRLCEDIQSIQVQSNGFKENLCLPGTCYAGFPVTKIRLIRLFW